MGLDAQEVETFMFLKSKMDMDVDAVNLQELGTLIGLQYKLEMATGTEKEKAALTSRVMKFMEEAIAVNIAHGEFMAKRRRGDAAATYVSPTTPAQPSSCDVTAATDHGGHGVDWGSVGKVQGVGEMKC